MKIRSPRESRRFLHGARVVLVSLKTSQFMEMCGNIVPASWLACIGSLGHLCDKWKIGCSSSEFTLISKGVFSFGSTAGCSTRILCESGSSPETPPLKRSRHSGTSCDQSWCVDTYTWRILLAWGDRTHEDRSKHLQLAHGSQPFT